MCGDDFPICASSLDATTSTTCAGMGIVKANNILRKSPRHDKALSRPLWDRDEPRRPWWLEVRLPSAASRMTARMTFKYAPVWMTAWENSARRLRSQRRPAHILILRDRRWTRRRRAASSSGIIDSRRLPRALGHQRRVPGGRGRRRAARLGGARGRALAAAQPGGDEAAARGGGAAPRRPLCLRARRRRDGPARVARAATPLRAGGDGDPAGARPRGLRRQKRRLLAPTAAEAGGEYLWPLCAARSGLGRCCCWRT